MKQEMNHEKTETTAHADRCHIDGTWDTSRKQ
jgi:hypothetical protein